MPSKLTSTSSRSLIVATMGWVEGSWSCRYAQVFSIELNVVHACVHSVASAVAMVEAHSAKDSLSHRSFPQRMGDARAKHVELGEGDRARVLHGPRVELGNEELIIFFERVCNVELLFVVRKPLPSFLKHIVGVEVLGEACATEHSEWDNPAAAAREFAAFNVVRAGAERRDVARDARSWFEYPGFCAGGVCCACRVCYAGGACGACRVCCVF